ncbi:PEP-CTERM/exosortase system-associated acyltransferase [Vreelandella sp. V005]|uniref:PEP-CTERM/exosortase system-associated acyltransferase n=1 Tax=Vreelandella sp. V005 TaxID=3459608 RepID=UPI004043A3B8
MVSQGGKKNITSPGQDILITFKNDYKFIIAKTPQEKKRALELRHKVFLEELRYKMKEDKIQRIETDEYDEHSLHCLIEHRRSGLLAGCMRLIIPSDDTESKFYKLPVEIQGKHSLNHKIIHPAKMPKLQICEVSRLAISQNFRSYHTLKKGNREELEEVKFTSEEERTFPVIAIALFLCTYSLAILSGKHHVFAMMEPRLPRLLALSGFHFTQVSGAIEHHGLRYAYYIDHLKAEIGMHEKLKPLYLNIKESLEPQLKELLAKKDSSSAVTSI